MALEIVKIADGGAGGADASLTMSEVQKLRRSRYKEFGTWISENWVNYDQDHGGTISVQELKHALTDYHEALWHAWLPPHIGCASHEEGVTCCAFGGTEGLVATSCVDGAVRVWKTQHSEFQLAPRARSGSLIRVDATARLLTTEDL